MSIFGDLERFAADLYPYRWPITIGLLIALAAAVAHAYNRGWHLIVWQHRLASAIIAIAVLVVAVPAGNYLLSPLWERSFLEEANPLALAEGDMDAGLSDATPSGELGSDGAATPGEFEPRLAYSGEISGADEFHFGSGRAMLIETAPGQYTLRFEDFSVRNGPDLFVYLSPAEDGYAEGAINLGELKATDGAFNYDIPPGTDVAQFKSAIVWCKQFAVLFATAPFVEE